MSTIPVAPPEPELAPPLHAHRFSVEEFEHLLDIGVFKSGDPVELLEGWIVDKMTQYPPHASASDYVEDALRAALPAEWRLREQKPIRTADSLPEPDIAVVRGPKERYRRRHPIPADVAFVVEISDTTLREDRHRKGRIYARARIPIYWIVNLPGAVIEVYSHPRAGKTPGYRQCQEYARNDSVPLVIEGREIARIPVQDLLPG